ncbi:hypothetical protein [Pantoea ananatis]|uniref:hypothetical protein n=1 Tax=Pantoea ananas TaxID=553 RepID=UPI000CEB5341|nr:hypothetical protein [Pantoea ananatis]AVG75455.1 hypothetical protein B9Q16_05295 [Pantoea ananatis]
MNKKISKNSSTLIKVDPFSSPFELWETREPTAAERDELLKRREWKPFYEIKVGIQARINSALDAAKETVANKEDNRISHHTISYIKNSHEYAAWRSYMPKRTPSELVNYQESYPPKDFDIINRLVSRHGIIVPEGQTFFHGGVWPSDENGNPLNSISTKRVLSTSFCPKVALNNSEWQGKAYEAGRIDLMVITAKKMTKKAFIFPIDEGTKGHELEVLFEEGAQLNLISNSMVNSCYKVSKCIDKSGTMSKKITANVLEIEIN